MALGAGDAAAQQFCLELPPFNEVLVLNIGTLPNAAGETHVELLGEHIGTCGAGTSRPLTGSLHIDGATQTIHLGTISHNSSEGCVPVFIQGRLDSTLNGDGYFRNLAGNEGAITFNLVPCPAIPEAPEAETASGEGTGTVR